MIEKYKMQCLNAKKSKRLKLKKVIFAMFRKVIALSCISGVVIIGNFPLLDAHEAHIINVVAEIHKLDDPVFSPTSMSFCTMEEGVDITSTDPDDAPVVVHYEVGAGTLNPDLVINPDCDSLAGAGDPSIAHIDITQQDTVIKAVTCTADGLHQGRVVYEAYHFDLNLCPVVCGDCEGKVSSLTLKYNGSQAGLIKVVQKKDGDIVFEGIVEPNGQFSFAGTANGTLSTEITMYVNDVENTKIHTSCSELIGPSMVFGDFTIIAGESKVGGPFCPIFGDIVLNEFLPNPDGDDNAPMPDGEWVELYNNSSFNMDVAGWHLYDSDDNQPLKIALSNSDNNNNILDSGETVVPAHGWLVVYVNGKYNDWLNNIGGDSVRLYNNEINTGALIDSHTYVSDALSGKSYARIPDGTGAWVDPIPTPGTPNKVEDLANNSVENIDSTNLASSVPVDSPVESVPEPDVAVDSEVKNEGLSDVVDDNEDPLDDDSNDIQENNEVIAKDEEAADTASDDEADDSDDNPGELEAETVLGAEDVVDDDSGDSNNLEEDDLDSEVKNEDLLDTVDSDEVPADDDSDTDAADEVIVKDEESVGAESEDEVADDSNNDNNLDELEPELIEEDDIPAEEIENITDSNDNDDPQTEDNETVDDDGDGELPITPDEGAVIDFNLNL